jgi:uncharacterized membrane protein
VPAVDHRLWSALLHEWPAFLSYALSFLIIGIIWAQHHGIFRHIVRSDHIFLLINVIFLMWVAFIPFPTALLSDYLENPGEQQIAMEVYAGTFLIGALLFNLLWRYAVYGRRLTAEDADEREIQLISRSYTFGPVLYGIDLGLGFVSAVASLILFILIALFYAVSPLLNR